MPSRYKRDLRCRACGPVIEEKEQNQNKQQEQEEQEEQEEDHPWSIEDQDHLETCSGYSELWDGLGPMTELLRIKYFMRVKVKRLKQQQQRQQQSRQ